MAAAAVSVAIAAAVPLPARADGTGPRSYYLDADHGDDAAAGTSAATAWRTVERASTLRLGPGDRLLLRRGGRWTGQLIITAQGTASARAVVGAYGPGSTRPRIDAAGTAESAVLVKDSTYLTVSGLELTNTNGDTVYRSGLIIRCTDMGEVPGLTVRDLLVHDTDGAGKHAVGAAGIMASITGTTTPTWFRDLLIEQNTVHDIHSYGIETWSSWMRRNGRDDFYPSETGLDQVGPWTPSRGTVIRNNTVHDVTGGGIATFHTDGALVAGNRVDRAVRHRTSPYGGNAGIWWEGNDNIVIRDNEVSNTGFNGPGTDGMAFDCDADNNGSLVEKNYSHDNDGGFFLTVSFGQVWTTNTIVRGNRSERDGFETLGFSTATRGTVVEDNVLLVADRTVVVEPPLAGPAATRWTPWSRSTATPPTSPSATT